LVREALDLAPERLVLGIGGTASTDGGAGALMALGVHLVDDAGRPIGLGLHGLANLAAVDLSGLDPRLLPPTRVEVVIATDVISPFTGPAGAACAFGPQKGLGVEDVREADAVLARFARLLVEAGALDVTETPGAGAGGGLAGGLAAVLRSIPVPGTDVLFSLIGLDEALLAADLAITAEGRLDEQSLRGKAPVALARRAGEHGVPCIAVAGSVAVDEALLQAEGIVAAAGLVDREPDLARAMKDARPLLTQAARDLIVRLVARGDIQKGPAPEEPAL
jgi:glycerate kinase